MITQNQKKRNRVAYKAEIRALKTIAFFDRLVSLGTDLVGHEGITQINDEIGHVIKLIAQKLGVPFVKGDATKFSETGYVGGDVGDLVRDLIYEANEDFELAENGIIYIDEIDKIASSHNLIGHDVSRTGVQRALLKPMEETDVDLKVPHDPISQIQAIEHGRIDGVVQLETGIAQRFCCSEKIGQALEPADSPHGG